MPEKLTESLKSEAKRLGFDLVGTTPAVRPFGFDRLTDWLEAGFDGEMHYISERKRAYEHPAHVLEGAKSILMLALNYHSQPRSETVPGTGKIARYAWGSGDYHDLIHQKLKQLCRFANEISPEANVRGVVDTAPLMERDFAKAAGMGWAAKNTMLINKQIGSWFLLAALLVDQELKYDAPHETSHCGTCTACIEACPTDAFPQPHVLDATKCISYLTIEHRTAIPMELRPLMDDWLLGCDVCQEVCPWNSKAPQSNEEMFQPLSEQNPVDLLPLFSLTDEAFRKRFRKTPLWRPKRRGILRNAAIVLGNHPCDEAIPALEKGLNDPEPLIRGASAWALGRQTGASLKQILDQRLEIETESDVRQEIQEALLHLN